MISIGPMGIEAASLVSAPINSVSIPNPEAESSGFEAHLSRIQAPPGDPPPKSPPPQANQGVKEQETNEPNAQSKKPDLSSKEQNKAKDAKDAQGQGQSSNSKAVGQTGPIDLSAEVASLLASNISTAKLASRAGVTATAPGKTAPASPAGPKTQQVSLSELPTSSKAVIVEAKATYEPNQSPSQTAPIEAQSSVTPAVPQETTVTSTATRIQPADTPTQAIASPADATNKPSAAAVNPQPDPVPTQNGDGYQLVAGLPSSDGKQASHYPAPISNPSADGKSIQPTQIGANLASGGHPQPNQGGSHQPNNRQPQADPGDLLRQISDHTEKLVAAKAVENVTVHLASDDDTNVTLTVKTNHAGVQAQIVTNSEGLKSALHQNRQDLDRAFQNKGMNLGGLSVDLKDSSNQGAPEQKKTLIGASSALKAKPETAAPHYVTTGGVDLAV